MFFYKHNVCVSMCQLAFLKGSDEDDDIDVI